MRHRETDQLMAAERAADAARLQRSSRQFQRHRGVAWAGLEPDPAQPRSEQALRARVADRLATRQAWRETSDSAFLDAICASQAAAREAYLIAERARAGVARGDPATWRAEVLTELTSQAARLSAALRQARSALRS